MIENKNLIQDIISIQRFQSVLSIYFKVLTPVVIIISILGVTVIRSLHFHYENIFFDDFLSTILIVVVSTSIILISYMLYILLKEKRKNWIVLFLVMVLLPYFLSSMVFQQFMFIKIYAAFPTVILYYIYCFLLKSKMEKWISEYYWDRSRIEEKKEKEEKFKIGLL